MALATTAMSKIPVIKVHSGHQNTGCRTEDKGTAEEASQIVRGQTLNKSLTFILYTFYI